jgi:hypothetical protein
MEEWSVRHHVFVMKMFLTSESVVKTQWIFRQNFLTGRRGAITSHNIILIWVQIFWETTSVKSNKPCGKQWRFCTPKKHRMCDNCSFSLPVPFCFSHTIALNISLEQSSKSDIMLNCIVYINDITYTHFCNITIKYNTYQYLITENYQWIRLHLYLS